jgi:hypothetical protein
MHRRHLLLLPAALLLPGNALAAEAAPLTASIGDMARVRLEARLQAQGYTMTGETRRKGEFLIVTANRSNAPWRLVVDGRTGEIVGQRLISGASGQD